MRHIKPLPEDYYLMQYFEKKSCNYFELCDLFWAYTSVPLDAYNTEDFSKSYLRTFVSGEIIDIFMEPMHEDF